MNYCRGADHSPAFDGQSGSEAIPVWPRKRKRAEVDTGQAEQSRSESLPEDAGRTPNTNTQADEPNTGAISADRGEQKASFHAGHC